MFCPELDRTGINLAVFLFINQEGYLKISLLDENGQTGNGGFQ
jgi:hypothetical protein